MDTKKNFVFVPIERSRTAEVITDSELLEKLGIAQDLEMQTHLGTVITNLVSRFPADYTYLFQNHTDKCPVTKEPYFTSVADDRQIYCSGCGNSIGMMVRYPEKIKK